MLFLFSLEKIQLHRPVYIIMHFLVQQLVQTCELGVW